MCNIYPLIFPIIFCKTQRTNQNHNHCNKKGQRVGPLRLVVDRGTLGETINIRKKTIPANRLNL